VLGEKIDRKRLHSTAEEVAELSWLRYSCVLQTLSALRHEDLRASPVLGLWRYDHASQIPN
jgi:hypothetical protein